MFKNYLKIAFRSLWRKRAFSLLNILGLAIGIAAALIIFLVIVNETGFDSFHTKKDRIFRVGVDLTYHNGAKDYEGSVPILMADAMRQDFPQLEKVAATWRVNKAQIAIPANGNEGEKLFREEDDLFYVEPAFFDIFDFPWIAGNPATALKEPYTMAIDRTVAKRWFGGDPSNAIGRTVLINDKRTPYKITGIMQDPPPNTDISMQVVFSYASFRAINRASFADQNNWGSVSSASEFFGLLAPGKDLQSLNAQIPAFSKRHFGLVNVGGAAVMKAVLLSLNGQHFDDRYGNYGKAPISLKELWALGLIGIFLILVACINFINLSTAQSVNRSKEIGVRKVLGSNRPQLLGQFLQETGLITLIALILACILAELALPYIAGLLERDDSLSLSFIRHPSIIFFLLGTGLVVTFSAGFYPAMILSGFDPIAAIKNKVTIKTAGGLSLRRGLVILQFVIAQLLIIGTLVVIKQMDFFRNRPTGFDRKAIALIELPSSAQARQSYTFLKDKIARIPGVQSASLCDVPPETTDAWNTDFHFDRRPNVEDFSISLRFADSDYLRTFNMKMAVGRMPYYSDTARELVVNEATVKMLGFKSDGDILGKTLNLGAQASGVGSTDLPIVGVLQDFNNKPLNIMEGIKPVVITSSQGGYSTLAIRMDPREIEKLIPAVRAACSETFPEHLFEVSFFDDMVLNFYHSEAIASKLFKIFAVLAIFISCLGLYGLVSFMAAQKTKEVGIRKVLGASIQSIVYLFSKEFTILIFIAFVAAAPLGYYFMLAWLNGFYYRTQIGWEVFAVAIVLSILIAWATVGYRAVRAALANPLKSLKYE